MALVRTGALARLRSQRGSALVEIMMTALVLSIVSAGIFASLDRASATSGEEKARASASLVAEQDQERLRAMDTQQLSNRRETRTVPIRTVNYTVTSRAQWVSDSSGTISCTNPTASADYIKITSTVTWPSIGNAKPVTAESIVAPRPVSGRGNLSVQIIDRDANPVVGIPVRVTGGSVSINETTDELGCVYVGQIPAGSYNVQFASTGFVTPDGTSSVNDPASVSSGATTTKTYEYDRAGSIGVTFDTRVGGTTFAQTGRYVSVGHARLATPRVFGNGTAQNSISATGLYPFTSAYGVYAGRCTGNDPSAYGQSPATALLTPGGALGVTVREPALNVRTMRSGTVRSGARVFATVDTTGCPADLIDMGTTNTNGALDNPGLPYGRYDICAEILTSQWRRGRVSNVLDTNPNGTSTITIDMNTDGRCP